MGDIDQGDALLLQHPHHFKELVHLLDCQRGGGLVQDNHLRIVGDCLGDLAHLPLGNGHVPHRLGQVHGHTELSEQLGGLLFHATFIHDPHGIGGVTSKEQVVDDVPLQALVQLLVDHGDPVFQGVFRTGKADFLSVQIDLSLVLLIGAEQALHHGRLTGAVFAHQSHDRSTLYVQVDMVKHPVSAERLAHTANRQDDIVFRICHSRYSRLCSSSFRKKSGSAGAFAQKSAIRENSFCRTE